MADVAEISLDSALKSIPWEPGDDVLPKAVYFKKLPSYEEIFQNILLKNQLCILGPSVTANWVSRQLWVLENGKPNFEYLSKHYGESLAPVADCSGEEFSSHPKSEMKVHDFITYWQEYAARGYPVHGKCLYLKDWHFTRDFPNCKMYTPPAFLSSDWLNEFWETSGEETPGDDYKFVYMGPKNSWTPFHADVLHSYSWSANICGCKKWIFYPPGTESNLRDQYGQLVFDLRDLDKVNKKMYPNAYKASGDAITIIQEPGEIIFVPTGWHHQVFNLEDTISINHNWTNGCGAHLCWWFLKSRLTAVKKEIEDCRNMDGWDRHCQLILLSDSGIDYKGFFKFMSLIAEHRIHTLQRETDTETADDFKSLKLESCLETGYPLEAGKVADFKILKPDSQLESKHSNQFLCLLTAERSFKEINKESFKSDNCEKSDFGFAEKDNFDRIESTHVEPNLTLLEPVETTPRIQSDHSKNQVDHSKCPHWSHCGPNLALFDLDRVKAIVSDMLNQPEFVEAVLPELTIHPSTLITRINHILDTWR